MTLRTEKLGWDVDGEPYEGHAVWDYARGAGGARPAVVICHAWAGQGDFEQAFAAHLAGLGYVGVAIDVYGKGKRGTNAEECRALMMPLAGDRARLERRLVGAVAAVRTLPVVDGTRVAAIGFCFGGLCALDLARAGADVRGVVAFHGLLHARPMPSVTPVRAKVLALHGFDDPMATPDAMVAFAREMTAAGADWQVHAYGGTVHAFTNPGAADAAGGKVYSARADRRARAAMADFLAEVFAS
jgi:dienelactone hydrolase